MESERRNVYTVVVLVALVGVVFSCVVGALAGGIAGFAVAKRQAARAGDIGWGDLPGYLGLPWLEEHSCSEHGHEGTIPVPPLGGVPFGVEGAIIVDVIEETPAEEADLQAGDVIVAIDSTPIDARHKLPDVIAQYVPGDRVTVRYVRGLEENSVRVKLSANPEDSQRAYLGVYYEMLGPQGWEAPGG